MFDRAREERLWWMCWSSGLTLARDYSYWYRGSVILCMVLSHSGFITVNDLTVQEDHIGVKDL